MMRKVTIDAVTELPPSSLTPASLARDIDLRAVTPVYLGSARPAGIDKDYPFRGPSLRGNLRTWWRAVHPTQDLSELRNAERALFGGIHDEQGQGAPRASRVSLGLARMSSRVSTRKQLNEHLDTDLPYALWVDRAGTETRYHLQARARLQLTLRPRAEDELPADAAPLLERALKAMVLLGGAGSRTRRGLGRLWSDELLGPTVANAESLAEMLSELAPTSAPRGWPSLAGMTVAWKSGSTYGNAALAAQAALEVLQLLRGMRPDGDRFDGSERLEEAEQDWFHINHGMPLHQAFAAALGMPLAYRKPGVLVARVVPHGHETDRLPSPLHVRPVPTPNGWAAVILCLQPWYTGAISSSHRPHEKGSLNPCAVNIMVAGLAREGWLTVPVVGAM
ncbi:MAG: RAMP superfamily CRISPR-associated protein [Myxococcota bacterium]